MKLTKKQKTAFGNFMKESFLDIIREDLKVKVDATEAEDGANVKITLIYKNEVVAEDESLVTDEDLEMMNL